MQPNTVFDAQASFQGNVHRVSIDSGRKALFWLGDLIVGEALWEEGEFRWLSGSQEWLRWDRSVLGELRRQILRQVEKRAFGF